MRRMIACVAWLALLLFGAVPVSSAHIPYHTSISSVGIDYANDRSNSKSKTLGTIGEGNIQIANIDESDTTLLNRDITDNEVDIYAIESHKGLKGSLDTRLLTEQGRDQIAEDILKSKMIVDTLKLIATTDKVGVEEFFSETDKSHTTYETVKETIAKDPNLAAMLQDPNLTAQDKEAMLNDITAAVMEKLGYETYDNKVIAKDDIRSGYYSEETGDAYINDRNIRDTEGLVTVAGHEMAHAMDDQNGDNTQYSEADRETYANNYGSNLTSYTDMALDINGYDDGMASSNSHTGNDSGYVTANNKEFAKLDKTKGDDAIILVPVVIGVLELIDKGITAIDVYQLEKAIKEGRIAEAEALAIELGIGVTTEVVPGNKILIKLGKAVGIGSDAKNVAKMEQKVDASGGSVVTKKLATGTDEAMFWSGVGRGGDTIAASAAAQQGKMTLETTLAARGIKLPAWDPANPASVAAWRQASHDFAAGASGNVRVLQGDVIRSNSVWAEVEFPALKANPNVKSITSIDATTGKEVLLWSR